MLKKYSKTAALMMLVSLTLTQNSFAEGGKEFMSSLLLPTTGQAMNGELGARKTKLMAGVEVAAITAVTVLGIASGGGIVLLGAAPLAANHLWSATDAYKSARAKQDSGVQENMSDAQRDLDLSRQRRFEREQNYRSSIRDRIQRASELSQE